MKKALVVGYGSIGARHTRLLRELGCNTAILSRHAAGVPAVYEDIAVALSEHEPDYVVIANPTSRHHDTLAELAAANFAGDVLVEKPLFDVVQPFPTSGFRRIGVGYNLRFTPVLRRLQELVSRETVLTVQAYVGQYLPDWRPETDYRCSYSAHANEGGGVLRDLSHELDYIGWLFGEWEAVTACGGHVSPLEIDSDDVFVVMMRTRRCPVLSVQMSYLDRDATRRVTVNTTSHTIEADLIGGRIAVDGVAEFHPSERDGSYLAMHRAMLSGEMGTVCSVEEGMATMNLIGVIELANRTRKWITQ